MSRVSATIEASHQSGYSVSLCPLAPHESLIRYGEENLRGELREAAQRLTDEKVDRTILGELLIELGNNLKSGRSITDMLDLLVKDGGTG
jgi:hypothetical protein